MVTVFASYIPNVVIIKNIATLPAYFILCYVATSQGQLSVQVAILLGTVHAGLLFCVRDKWPRGYDIVPLALILCTGGAAFSNPWLLVCWLSLLTGMGIGHIVDRPRYMALLATACKLLLLLTLLFFFVLPHSLFNAIPAQQQQELLWIVQYLFAGWLVLQLLAIFTRSEHRVEPIVSSLSTMLCLVLAIATALLHYLQPQNDYLLQVLIVIGSGGVLACIAWLVWNPFLGEGLANNFFRHIMALTMPLDSWLNKLTQLANTEKDAKDFWRAAMDQLIKNTQLQGIVWEEHGQEFFVGEQQGHKMSQLSLAELNLTLFSRHRLLPTTMLNLWLLTRMALEYRQSKEREARMAIETRMRSIHELGARTTHDLKNLLHAITLLCSRQKENGEQTFTDVKREQLILLARRLETTLARLKGESMDGMDGKMQAQDWWDGAIQRNKHDSIIFLPAKKNLKFELPADLFDRTLENLIHNSLRKQGREGQLDIEVDFTEAPALTVRDNGDSIPENIAARLFNTPLPSNEGMGIGLFQLKQSATKQAYQINITANSPGNVAITLEPS